MTIADEWKQRTCIRPVVLSDGIQRLICTHAHVPEAYLPKDVYALNEEGSEYIRIGAYTIGETKSTQWFNTHNTHEHVGREGSPGNKYYIFHENVF